MYKMYVQIYTYYRICMFTRIYCTYVYIYIILHMYMNMYIEPGYASLEQGSLSLSLFIVYTLNNGIIGKFP